MEILLARFMHTSRTSRRTPIALAQEWTMVKIEGNLRPPAYRLRIGRWRVEYVVLDEEREVRIGRIFPRGGDSDYK
jgi:hypothetical protein